MRFAILGSDEPVLRLVTAIAACDEHTVVGIYGADQHRQRIFDLAPAAKLDREWESLLHEETADAIIVATKTPWEDRDDMLRKLFQVGTPLLIVHPACEAIVAFELEMIREDVGGVIVPYVPGQRSDTFHAALALVRGEPSSLGTVTQVVVERPAPNVDRDVVLRQLAGDVSLMRPFVGNVRRVGAMSPDANTAELANLTVNMTGESGVLGRWSSTTGSAEAAQLKIVGNAGTTILSMPMDGRPWTLNGDDGTTNSANTEAISDAQQMLADFTRAVNGEDVRPTWMEASRDSEVADTVQHSLRRGKTLELHHEEHSEEGTFKGIMSVGGCFLLLATMLILMVGGVFEGVQRPLYRKVETTETSEDDSALAERPPRRALWIRLWPAYPFLLFLSLQLLRLVFLAPRPTPEKQQI